MLDRCIDFFLTKPRRLIAAGHGLIRMSSVLVVAGLGSAIATSAVPMINRSAVGASSAPTLAEVWPGVPTWWIPESYLGYAFALALGLLGVCAVRTGRTYQRMLGY